MVRGMLSSDLRSARKTRGARLEWEPSTLNNDFFLCTVSGFFWKKSSYAYLCLTGHQRRPLPKGPCHHTFSMSNGHFGTKNARCCAGVRTHFKACILMSSGMLQSFLRNQRTMASSPYFKHSVCLE